MKQASRLLLFCLVFTVLSLLVAGSAVAQESEPTDDAGGTMHMDMDMPSGLPAVGPDVTIRFAATVGSRPVSCGMIYSDLGTAKSRASLNDFRFYVSNLRLVDAAGKEVPVTLMQDGLWQYKDVALLDFEDGTGGCSEAGTPETNDKIVGTIAAGDYQQIRFDLGIPFELDHLDTTTAPAPLNLPALWWNWQVGYKFVRIDLQTPDSESPAWFIHLGSTDCDSANGNTAPSAPCSNPNVASITLDGFNPVENFVVADLAGLLQNVNLNENSPMPPGCMSGPDDTDCAGLFPGFGLDLASGQRIEGSAQTFFRVE